MHTQTFRTFTSKDPTASAEFTWTRNAEDPDGELARAIHHGDIGHLLAALGDSCPQGQSRTLESTAEAAQRLTALERLQDTIKARSDALVVAMADQLGASWADIATALDYLQERPGRPKRSAAQRRYERGRQRVYQAPTAGTRLPSGHVVGHHVQVLNVSGYNQGRTDLIGLEGTVHSEVDGHVCVTGLVSPTREALKGIPGLEPHELTDLDANTE